MSDSRIEHALQTLSWAVFWRFALGTVFFWLVALLVLGIFETALWFGYGAWAGVPYVAPRPDWIVDFPTLPIWALLTMSLSFFALKFALRETLGRTFAGAKFALQDVGIGGA